MSQSQQTLGTTGAPSGAAGRLARIRALASDEGADPELVLARIAEVLGHRETPGDIYQKPLG